MILFLDNPWPGLWALRGIVSLFSIFAKFYRFSSILPFFSHSFGEFEHWNDTSYLSSLYPEQSILLSCGQYYVATFFQNDDVNVAYFYCAIVYLCEINLKSRTIFACPDIRISNIFHSKASKSNKKSWFFVFE